MTDYRIIETERVEAMYGFKQTRAIIEDEAGQRYYICDGYGGEGGIRGGAYRWGLAYPLDGDLRDMDIATLLGTPEDYFPVRPIDTIEMLGWPNARVERIAKGLGL